MFWQSVLLTVVTHCIAFPPILRHLRALFYCCAGDLMAFFLFVYIFVSGEFVETGARALIVVMF